MITSYRAEQGRCIIARGDLAADTLYSAAWIDLFEPTAADESLAEATVGAAVPTRDEMAEIEPSSRLYEEAGAAVMTAPLLIRSQSPYPDSTEVTFVLTERHLVTVRYAEPVSLATFAAAAERSPSLCSGPREVFVGLLDAMTDRLADTLEETGRELDRTGRDTATSPPVAHDLRTRLQDLGRSAEIVSKARESLVGLARLVAFARGHRLLRGDDAAMGALKTVATDVAVLLEHTASLSSKITFLLDASLGLINIEQNAIIKTFSVVAVMFLPPTLIASIYGMNFEVMPELGWRFGYPMALAAMVASMIAPFLYFKRKGWV